MCSRMQHNKKARKMVDHDEMEKRFAPFADDQYGLRQARKAFYLTLFCYALVPLLVGMAIGAVWLGVRG